MEKKQTAVEWYIEQEQILGDKLSEGIIGLSLFNDEVAKLKIQAKQMEKEQMIDAVKYGYSDWGSAKNAEQYFNETYGGAEWQAKQMYSKEEVLNLLIEMNSWPTTFEGKEDITEWFEEFTEYHLIKKN